MQTEDEGGETSGGGRGGRGRGSTYGGDVGGLELWIEREEARDRGGSLLLLLRLSELGFLVFLLKWGDVAVHVLRLSEHIDYTAFHYLYE